MSIERQASGNAAFDAVALRTLTRRLTAADDHEAILETIVDSGPDGQRPSPALLATRTLDGAVRLAARSEVPDDIDLPSCIPEDTGIPLVHAIRERSAIWIETASERDRWFPNMGSYGQNPSAGAILPLEVNDAVVGAIGLCFWYEHRFSERERQHYQVLADFCALAVERLELVDTLSARRRRAEAASRRGS